MNIIEFINARLDDDEQIAQSAYSDVWHYDTDSSADSGYGWVHDSAGRVITTEHSGDGSVTEYDGRNMARHDPARVLREVEAKRKILGFCRQWLVSGGEQDGEMSRKHALDIIGPLASPYSDHPDYQQEWA